MPDDPAEQIRALTASLLRERARNAGLERGLTALSRRVEELQRENGELRRTAAARTGRAAGDARDRRRFTRAA